MVDEHYELYGKCRCCANGFDLTILTPHQSAKRFLWRCIECQKARRPCPIPVDEWWMNR